MKELKDWRGNRADAGRIAQGLPKNNKFRGAPRGKAGKVRIGERTRISLRGADA